MTSHDHDLVKWAPSRLYRKGDGIGQTQCSYEHYLVYFCFQRQSSRSLGRSSPNFDTCSMITRIYKIGSEIEGPPKMAAPKHQNLGPISDNFVTWSRIYPERNKISSKRKRRCKQLQSLLRMRISFGELWSQSARKTGPEFRPTQRVALRGSRFVVHKSLFRFIE